MKQSSVPIQDCFPRDNQLSSAVSALISCISMTVIIIAPDKRGYLVNTLQPLYNTVCYNTVSDITWFKDGSQKCIDYIEK